MELRKRVIFSLTVLVTIECSSHRLHTSSCIEWATRESVFLQAGGQRNNLALPGTSYTEEVPRVQILCNRLPLPQPRIGRSGP